MGVRRTQWWLSVQNSIGTRRENSVNWQIFTTTFIFSASIICFVATGNVMSLFLELPPCGILMAIISQPLGRFTFGRSFVISFRTLCCEHNARLPYQLRANAKAAFLFVLPDTE